MQNPKIYFHTASRTLAWQHEGKVQETKKERQRCGKKDEEREIKGKKVFALFPIKTAI